MTDGLERLARAMREEASPAPRAEAREAALAAAMAAFEAAGQGSADERRPRGGRARWPGAILGRTAMILSTHWRGLALAGGSAAVLLVAVVATVDRTGHGPVVSNVAAPEGPADRLADAAALRPEAEEVAEAEADLAVTRPPAPAPVPAAEARRAAVGVLASRLRRAPEDVPVAAPGLATQGRDRFEAFEDGAVRVSADDPVSTFSVDVDTASYALVRRMLSAGMLPPPDAVRIEEMVNYFDYDYPLPADRAAPFAVDVALTETPWNPDTRLMRIGLQGYDIVPAERPRATLVFLIDTSGSMDAPDRLPLLRTALRLLLDSLAPEDRVAIVAYAGRAGTVLEPTPVADRTAILAALDRLSAGGSTAGGEGIRQAYALAEAAVDPAVDPGGVTRVILATDGDFNVGIRDAETLEGFVARKRETGVALTVLGFGRGNLNDALMQRLAQAGNGAAAYIDTLAEARKVLVEEASGTLFPIASDVKVQVEFNPAAVAEYRLIGYETRALDRADFANDRVDAGEIGAGHSVTALYEITPVGSPARLTEALRYGAPAAEAPAEADEIAHLRLRYKLPGETASRLIERAVTEADAAPLDAPLMTGTRWAAAVAGFGQILRGGRHTGAFSWEDVLALAQSARGDDPYGYRAEFVTLVHLARSAEALERQP